MGYYLTEIHVDWLLPTGQKWQNEDRRCLDFSTYLHMVSHAARMLKYAKYLSKIESLCSVSYWIFIETNSTELKKKENERTKHIMWENTHKLKASTNMAMILIVSC